MLSRAAAIDSVRLSGSASLWSSEGEVKSNIVEAELILSRHTGAPEGDRTGQEGVSLPLGGDGARDSDDGEADAGRGADISVAALIALSKEGLRH